MSLFWPKITSGAIIDIIAPAGRFDASIVVNIQAFLQAKGWQARCSADLLGPHDFLANSDAQRFSQLAQALQSSDSDIIWCARGGHGTTRLISDLLALPSPPKVKLLVGFSDISALHLVLNQQWHWPSLHAPMARQVALGLSDERDVDALLKLWQEGVDHYVLHDLQPQNTAALSVTELTGVTVGTCLSLLQVSLATSWQVDALDKILLIEDINEPAYRLDRLLTHLSNAGIWQQARAIVLGDFIEYGAPLLEQQKLARVLREFSQAQTVPVFALTGFGHGLRNKPIPLGLKATLRADAGRCSLYFKP
jgi:muramoyltetrapeptide carboxypeptidase